MVVGWLAGEWWADVIRGELLRDELRNLKKLNSN